MKIGNTKINFKFKLGWKEASKKERILFITFYIILIGGILYLIIK